MVTSVIKVLALQEDQNIESTLFRFKKGWTLRFVIGSSLMGRSVKLFTNYPADHESFVRAEYRHLDWTADDSNGAAGDGKNTGADGMHADITFQCPGSFRYYFIDSDEEPRTGKELGSGYAVCDPELLVGPGRSEVLPMDAISAQTVLSKCLGPLSTWSSRLRVAIESGYNLIHFTPIQELGASHSAYCLSNQLELNSSFSEASTGDGKPANGKPSFDDVQRMMDYMRHEQKTLSVVDIVLNHTANESPWLGEHPECSYNLANSPHLRPAYLLDRVCWRATREIAAGRWTSSRSLPPEISNENHLNALRSLFKEVYLPQVRLHEFYEINIDEACREVRHQLATSLHDNSPEEYRKAGHTPGIQIIQDQEYKRFGSKVNLPAAVLLCHREIAFTGNQNEWLDTCCNLVRSKLVHEQERISREVTAHLDAAVENVIACCRYERLDSGGPKIARVTPRTPLVCQYFVIYGTANPEEDGAGFTLAEEEPDAYDPLKAPFRMAHNGWVMGDDPLRNFAEKGSNVYLRRELIAWGDSVKLRYGARPEDCPHLWSHMKTYVEQMATLFDGFRLDNCHSTPLPVAEFLLDAARRINPNLYVIAELFTSSENLDNVFINRLGINSLIRESMAAPTAHELGRLVYRYGGEVCGAFVKPIGPLRPALSHAIFYDQTHDNESPIERRSVWDLLPTAALISMASCSLGSNRGYDELVPHHIHVVNERRLYTQWEGVSSSDCANNDAKVPKTGDLSPDKSRTVSLKTGLVYARKCLNNLHRKLGSEGFSEIFVDQVDPNTIAVTRHNPSNHRTVVLVARTCFYKPENPTDAGWIRNLTIPGNVKRVLLEARLRGDPTDYTRDEQLITGLAGMNAEVELDLGSLDEMKSMRLVRQSDGITELSFTDFPPSSVIAFEVTPYEDHTQAFADLHDALKRYNSTRNVLDELLGPLSVDDFNYLLFRCDQEECDESGSGTYAFSNWKSFNYCGLAGIMFHMRNIRSGDDLGHPICGNLRDGDWLPEYIVRRLKRRPATVKLADWLESCFAILKRIPRYLIPRYFDLILTPVYMTALDQIWTRMTPFIQNGNHFTQLLALSGVSLTGYCKSSPLPPLSPLISPPVPSTVPGIEEGSQVPVASTIAAGFSHFATGYMRNWGRDTFISIRGLLLIPGLHQQARIIILAYAGTLRHGLIPNLLDRGVKARYNCRDAVWWWLESVKQYTRLVPGGDSILKEPVHRLYPTDDSEPHLHPESDSEFVGRVQRLEQVMQEAIAAHFTGIDFTERNAGRQIDEHMTHKGFHITAGVSRETGFVYGGNEWNCGTWMDKMGSSDKASNRGLPSSPRDGSAVELVGLCFSVVSWLDEMSTSGKYPFPAVVDAKDETGHDRWTWRTWADKIRANFEKHFWIAADSTHHLVNRRQIYKDSFGATHEWQDFQLRPNFPIAMVVAPLLFSDENAQQALKTVRDVLLGPLGMRTLDPSDWNYRGDYDNANDSTDKRIAHGFNYHQGPEWLWLTGFYLRAQLLFGTPTPSSPSAASSSSRHEIVSHVQRVMSRHYKHIESSEWFGLPELTNSSGKHCSHSCDNQAWSAATLIETLYDLQVNSLK